MRSSFVQADGVKLLVPLISPASTQQSIQVGFGNCLNKYFIDIVKEGLIFSMNRSESEAILLDS